jgi:hypothetical protein
VPLTFAPALTGLAIMFLLLSIVTITYITGKIAIVIDKKKRLFLIKNNKHKKDKNYEKGS